MKTYIKNICYKNYYNTVGRMHNRISAIISYSTAVCVYVCVYQQNII